MLGKINEELDPIQKNELKICVGKIKRALFIPIVKDAGLPSFGLTQQEKIENDQAVEAIKEISDFLGI